MSLLIFTVTCGELWVGKCALQTHVLKASLSVCGVSRDGTAFRNWAWWKLGHWSVPLRGGWNPSSSSLFFPATMRGAAFSVKHSHLMYCLTHAPNQQVNNQSQPETSKTVSHGISFVFLS
jgi:hypothetical protein